MNRTMTDRLPWVVAGALAALAAVLIWLAFPGSGTTATATPSPLNRIAASSWNGAAYSAGGGVSKLFYDRILPVDASKALYVTVTGTGRQANGDVLILACFYNAKPCDAYGGVRVGYTANHTWPNNSFTQSWCVTAEAGTQRLQLFLPSVNLTNTVYIEHVTVFVDGSDTHDACTTAGFQTP